MLSGSDAMKSAVPLILSLLLGLPAAAVLAQPRASSSGSDWTTYLGTNSRSGFAAEEELIDPSSAGTLAVRWSHFAGGAVSDEPVIARGVVFWGSWDGYEHATTIFGKPVWTHYLGRTSTGPECAPSEVGIAGSAAFSELSIHGAPKPVLMAPGGNAWLYALDARTGRTLWRTRLGELGSAFLWDSPLVYRGSVYIGVSSFGDCPLVQGRLVELDASTGKPVHVFDAVPSGCTGAGIWATPALDESSAAIYVVTGNDGDCDRPEPFSDAIVELRASDLSPLGSWAVPDGERVLDSDFGATPTVFDAGRAAHRVAMVGAVDKNGLYYAFRAGAVSAGPVWTKRIGIGGPGPQDGTGDIAPSSWDGSRLYVAGGLTSIHGTSCAGSLRALDPSDGRILWADCLGAPVLAAATAAPGVVFAAAGNRLTAAAGSTGAPLLSTAFKGALFWGPPAISEGTLYIGSMNDRLYALSPSRIFR
jgi:polyvinyl alcohol dehydrogenase (cytochrome)